MYINIKSNRSYNDLTQYPIMLWVILDSNSAKLQKLTKSLPTAYRDLSVPIGMLVQSDSVRKKGFQCTFNIMVLDLHEEYF